VIDKILTINGFEAEMNVLSINQGKILSPSTSCPEVFHGFPLLGKCWDSTPN
jgi:hypothetical protein